MTSIGGGGRKPLAQALHAYYSSHKAPFPVTLTFLQRITGSTNPQPASFKRQCRTALAELVIGWLLIRHSAVAHAKLGSATADDKNFYIGKIAAARWHADNVLPGLTLTRKLVENGTLELLDVPEGAF